HVFLAVDHGPAEGPVGLLHHESALGRHLRELRALAASHARREHVRAVVPPHLTPPLVSPSALGRPVPIMRPGVSAGPAPRTKLPDRRRPAAPPHRLCVTPRGWRPLPGPAGRAASSVWVERCQDARAAIDLALGMMECQRGDTCSTTGNLPCCAPAGR